MWTVMVLFFFSASRHTYLNYKSWLENIVLSLPPYNVGHWHGHVILEYAIRKAQTRTGLQYLRKLVRLFQNYLETQDREV